MEALGSPNLAGQAALVLSACPLLQCAGAPAHTEHAPEETAVHACLAAVFAVLLVSCLLINTPVLLLCAKAAPLPSWVDLEILPVARAEQTLWSRCWWEAAPCSAEGPTPCDAAWQDAFCRGR